MTIKELLTNTYKADFNWTEELDVKHYIPIMEKKMFVMDVIAICTDEVDGFISADRFKINIYFNMKVLGLYTNLEIATDFNEMIDQYDFLCENNLLNNVLGLFADDYSVMCKTLDDMLNELLIQNSIDMQIVKIANKISKIIDNASENLNKINLNSILPEGTDVNELINKLNMLK